MSERQTTTAQIICQGGLNSNLNHLDLSKNRPGWATRLLNFEPSLFGGYRRINGFLPLESNYEEVDPGGAEGPVLGIAIFGSDIIVARKQQSGNTYEFYRWGQGSDWIKFATGLTFSSSGVVKLRYATFNFDGVEKIIFVDGINNATIFDGTNWTSVSTTGSGVDYDNAGGNQVVDAPSFVTVFKNHIFMAGDPAHPNVVCHSAPNAEYDWTVASGAGQLNSGFSVMQIKPFRDENYVFGVLGIKKITVDPSANFVMEDVVKDIGCIASDSVQEVGGDLVYLSQDAIRTIAGTERIGDVELGAISKPIQQTLISLSNTYNLNSISSVLIRSKSQFRLFFNRAESTSLDTKGILGGLVEGPGGVNWEWSELRGFSAPVVTSGYFDNNEYIIHGDYSGRVYRQEVGNSFNGDPILAVYETPFLDFGDTEIRKTFRTATIFLRSEGTSSFDVNVRYDWDVFGTLNPDSYLFDEVNLLSWYGQAIYGSSPYSSISSPVVKHNIQGSGRSCRLIISSVSLSDPFSIQGIVYQMSPNDRK